MNGEALTQVIAPALLPLIVRSPLA